MGDVSMPSRMDRYSANTRSISSRTTKNQQLYKDLYSNKMYTEFTEFENNSNVVDLTAASKANQKKRRSDYNRTKLFYDNNQKSDDNLNFNINSSYQLIH